MINYLMKIIELITVITGNPVKIGRINMNDQNSSINIGGNVTGSKVISGDGNIVGNVNKIDQRNQSVSAGGNITGAFNWGSGSATSMINQLPASPDPAKPGLKELLTKLQDLIQNTAGLAEEDKAEALNHVNALAEIGKKPKEKSKSKGILRWFRGLLPELPAAAATVAELKDVIESVADVFAD